MSHQTHFEQHSDTVLAAIKEGASIPEAAELVGVAERTIAGWLSRGRKDPRSKYGGFAARVDQAFTARKLPAADDRPADRAELLLLASRAARAGNVQAMRLLGELLSPEPAEGDELARFEK